MLRRLGRASEVRPEQLVGAGLRLASFRAGEGERGLESRRSCVNKMARHDFLPGCVEQTRSTKGFAKTNPYTLKPWVSSCSATECCASSKGERQSKNPLVRSPASVDGLAAPHAADASTPGWVAPMPYAPGACAHSIGFVIDLVEWSGTFQQVTCTQGETNATEVLPDEFLFFLTTSPRRFTSRPALLPGLIGASVCSQVPGPSVREFPDRARNPFDIKSPSLAASTAGSRIIARTGPDREAWILRKARVDLAQGAEQK